MLGLYLHKDSILLTRPVFLLDMCWYPQSPSTVFTITSVSEEVILKPFKSLNQAREWSSKTLLKSLASGKDKAGKKFKDVSVFSRRKKAAYFFKSFYPELPS